MDLEAVVVSHAEVAVVVAVVVSAEVSAVATVRNK